MSTRLAYLDGDWDQARDVFTSWWRHQKPSRPLISIQGPREKPIPGPKAPPAPADPKAMWLDSEGNLARFEQHLRKNWHGGACFPYITAGLGPGNINLYLGSKPGFAPDTVWYNPCFDDPAKADLKFDPDNEYWQWTLRTTRLYQQAARGKFICGIPDLIEGLDILAGVLGTQELLAYLLDCPQEIHRLLRQMDDLYWKYFDPLYDIVKDERNGNAFIAFQIWGPGRTLKTQCDFAAMISPDMFAEFVCPYLERQCARADFSVFHLDGPSCICHLPHLLKVPSLKAVQWTPGAGALSSHSAHPVWWKTIWEKVYASGKSALVLGNPPELVEPFLKEFGWTGTFLSTGCDTERAGQRMLADSLNWGS